MCAGNPFTYKRKSIGPNAIKVLSIKKLQRVFGKVLYNFDTLDSL